MAKYKANNSKGLNTRENSDFLRIMNAKGIIGVDNSAPMITTPNIQAPLGALNYIRPSAVQTLTAPEVSDEIATPQKNGVFGDETVTIKLVELMGKTTPFNGKHVGGGKSSVNYSNVLRGAYYYQSTWSTDDLQEARVGAMQENDRANQAEAAMRALRIDRNKFFFEGVDAKSTVTPVYGFLTDPNLPAYSPISTGVWASAAPEKIYNDIVAMVGAVVKTSNGLADKSRGTFKLVLASNQQANIDRTNQYGLSTMAKLKEAYGDKLKIVYAPQLNGAEDDKDVAYMSFDMDGAEATWLNSYVEMARAYPLFVAGPEVSQQIAAATSGAICQYPMFVSRWSGLSA